MARDKRLLGAGVLLAGAAAAGIVQAVIMRAYVYAAVMGDWSHFAKTFGVRAPPNGPHQYCLDYCAADLPFTAGWIGITCFLVGLALVFRCWLKPFR